MIKIGLTSFLESCFDFDCLFCLLTHLSVVDSDFLLIGAMVSISTVTNILLLNSVHKTINFASNSYCSFAILTKIIFDLAVAS